MSRAFEKETYMPVGKPAAELLRGVRDGLGSLLFPIEAPQIQVKVEIGSPSVDRMRVAIARALIENALKRKRRMYWPLIEAGGQETVVKLREPTQFSFHWLGEDAGLEDGRPEDAGD